MCWQLRWLVLALCSAVLGCATITQKDSDEEHEEVPVQVLPDKDLIGVWDGTSVAYCSPVALYPHNCLGAADIRFTILRQEASSLTGFYTYGCPSRRGVCGGRPSKGRIDSISLHGRRLWLRVALPDGSGCLFTSPLHDSWMNGGYECREPMEQGHWQVERSY
jgi:hypothetical protein